MARRPWNKGESYHYSSTPEGKRDKLRKAQVKREDTRYRNKK